MTPGARVQAAIEILDEIRSGSPAEKALAGWARRSRFAGSKDRAAVRDHVFQALRCLRSYGCRGGAETGRGVMIGALRAAEIDLEACFNGEGHAPEPLTADELSAGRTPLEPGVAMDLPDWLVPLFINSLGGEVQARNVANQLKTRAPVMLRVNIRKTALEAALRLLADEGINVETVPIATTALRVITGARQVAQSAAYREGFVELQDGSSQAAMEMLDVRPTGCVLDYCAGGGGKVLALAARLEGQWVAHDALQQRMKDLPARARRAGVSVRVQDANHLEKQMFDLVLCDVPCSGSGTWRRTPDAKWRLTAADLTDLNRTQDAILDRAAGLVAPDGLLAYATCSVLAPENEERIGAFLARHPDWQVVSQRHWPVSDMGDGFFLAQLKIK
nr:MULTISPECIES: RsmB/NOP family class I SAM-dependent RNA methyltransferase [unclassified Roseovarius]